MERAAPSHRIVVSRRGGPDVLRWQEQPRPMPGPNEVRIEVEAAGVSAYDVMGRASWFPGLPKPPYTPGEDVVGHVDALGDGVDEPALGQRVAAWTFGRGGGYAEHVCVPAPDAVPVPAELDAAEAVALVVNYLTAELALTLAAGAKAGERVLVHGAAGGVGSAAVQLGVRAGLEVYGTASARNLERVAAMGATPIDYRAEDFVARVRERTGDGVHVVIDLIGGARQLWRSYRALRPGGRLVMLGMAGATRAGVSIIPGSLLTIGLLKLLPGKRLPMAPGMESYPREHPEWYRGTLVELFGLAASRELVPLVAERFPMADAARAHERLERGGHAGKIVLISDPR